MAEIQKSKMTDDQADKIIKDLEMIRKLAILDLYQKGYSQGDIADVLGVSQPTISNRQSTERRCSKFMRQLKRSQGAS